MSGNRTVILRLEELPPISEKRLMEMANDETPIDYSDIPELGDEWFDRAIAKREKRLAASPPPDGKKSVCIRLDSDILAFFREGGPGYQTRINQVLRAYMDCFRQRRAFP